MILLMSCWSLAYFSSEKAFPQDFDDRDSEMGLETFGDEEFYPAEPLFEVPDDSDDDNRMEVVDPLPAPAPPPMNPSGPGRGRGRFSRPNFGSPGNGASGTSPPSFQAPAAPLGRSGGDSFGRTTSGAVQFRKTGEELSEAADPLNQKKLQLEQLKERFQQTFR